MNIENMDFYVDAYDWEDVKKSDYLYGERTKVLASIAISLEKLVEIESKKKK